MIDEYVEKIKEMCAILAYKFNDDHIVLESKCIETYRDPHGYSDYRCSNVLLYFDKKIIIDEVYERYERDYSKHVTNPKDIYDLNTPTGYSKLLYYHNRLDERLRYLFADEYRRSQQTKQKKEEKQYIESQYTKHFPSPFPSQQN